MFNRLFIILLLLLTIICIILYLFYTSCHFSDSNRNKIIPENKNTKNMRCNRKKFLARNYPQKIKIVEEKYLSPNFQPIISKNVKLPIRADEELMLDISINNTISSPKSTYMPNRDNIIAFNIDEPEKILNIVDRLMHKFKVEAIDLSLVFRGIENHLHRHMTNFSSYFNFNCDSTNYNCARKYSTDEQIFKFFESQYLLVKNNKIYKHRGNYDITKFCYDEHVDIFAKNFMRKRLFQRICAKILNDSIDSNKKYIIFGGDISTIYFGNPLLCIDFYGELDNEGYIFKKLCNIFIDYYIT